MAENSKIEWTDATWNPVVGCTKVSPGCKNCYAKTLHDQRHKARLAGKRVPLQYAEPFEVVQLMPERLRDPLGWKRPRRVFVNSVSDLFHEDIPFGFIAEVFQTMGHAERHTFQVLTKRPERMKEFVDGWVRREGRDPARIGEPLPNVWLGVSVENQAAADERIPHLLTTPAAVRFLSVEPLLGPVDLSAYFGGEYATIEGSEPNYNFGIGWVIVGGESGPGARPCSVDWVRSVIGRCKAASIPVFAKQLGAVPFDGGCQDAGDWWPDQKSYRKDVFDGREVVVRLLKDKKGGDPAEWPESIRVRSFPNANR